LGETSLTEVKEFAEKHKLNNDQATEVLKFHEQVLADYVEAQQAEADKQLAEWRKEVIESPEYGGDNLEATKQKARKLVKTFASDGLIELLESTGYGDNPEVVKFLADVGGVFTDESLALGKRSSVAKTPEQVFYGN